MASPGIAAGAYARLAGLGDTSGGFAKTIGDTAKEGPNFGAVLRDVVGSVVEAGKKSDAQMQAAATGKANIVDVVTAVAETETAVEMMVSVRDRVIQAYEEIIRMPI